MAYRFILSLMLIILPLGAYASDADSARAFADSTGKKVLAVLNGGGSQDQKQQQLRQLFTDAVDIDWMAKFVLGRGIKQANADQQKRYMEAYRNYLLARYTTNFADYSGSNYTITSVKPAADNQFLVGMQIKSPNADQQDIRAGYRVRKSGGQFKIADIIIEGVSLVTTQRSEFSSVLERQGMDGLISSIKEKSENESKSRK